MRTALPDLCLVGGCLDGPGPTLNYRRGVGYEGPGPPLSCRRDSTDLKVAARKILAPHHPPLSFSGKKSQYSLSPTPFFLPRSKPQEPQAFLLKRNWVYSFTIYSLSFFPVFTQTLASSLSAYLIAEERETRESHNPSALLQLSRYDYIFLKTRTVWQAWRSGRTHLGTHYVEFWRMLGLQERDNMGVQTPWGSGMEVWKESFWHGQLSWGNMEGNIWQTQRSAEPWL